ncbi:MULTISPECIES: sigma-54-dependent transcriptional regulator [Marinomonas]|uniref:Sigma-54-dependent Fis family transcriptional regulator n=1 Tax=Marinomonas arctica TaxID=383750 RepID=A0A7H1J267_9GAMM|nr:MULTISPECIES: sigma-54 dependent transcriptional regulator [Marinomonas]MCS7488310.1 chemotaxis protein CheY [Marinomonas sp. BSi20414]QNT04583.1 sigma-54-dependent Fis family transcriptional regulator [Marinomonas arctica]GGN32926.1 sigma-54-dependent Fis family transcriptional regulator [Marinomonas arctica]
MKHNLYPQFKILLVDDEIAFLRSMSLTLEIQGFNHLITCSDPSQIPSLMETEDIGLVLLDLTMPKVSGQKVLAWLKEEYPNVCVIIISGVNQVNTAVECVKQGAFDYFVKTSDQNQILDGLKRAIRTQELTLENQALRAQILSNELEKPDAFANIITSDQTMWSAFRYIESIAKTRQPVLISGESGVGKELIANVIHDLSRCPGPLVSVNVAGVDDNVFADTLFGHARGAFTGADKTRLGLVEKAAGGTLFLDEIGDLSLASQVKLLRLLQEGEYYPVGSDKPKRMEARIVVATHQQLSQLQAEGKFRKDLFFRLKTHMVTIPPLRERLADLPLLIDHFMTLACKEMNKPSLTVPKSLSVNLSQYSFPGNARELKALIYDAVSQSTTDELNCAPFEPLFNREKAVDLSENTLLFPPHSPLPTLSNMADLLVEEAMKRANSNQSLAARMLGISQPALSKRLKNMKENHGKNEKDT